MIAWKISGTASNSRFLLQLPVGGSSWLLILLDKANFLSNCAILHSLHAQMKARCFERTTYKSFCTHWNGNVWCMAGSKVDNSDDESPCSNMVVGRVCSRYDTLVDRDDSIFGYIFWHSTVLDNTCDRRFCKVVDKVVDKVVGKVCKVCKVYKVLNPTWNQSSPWGILWWSPWGSPRWMMDRLDWCLNRLWYPHHLALNHL